MNVGGHKVFPYEIETVLKKHPKVEDVAVVPHKDPWLGEVPRAVVVRKRGRGRAIKTRDLEEFCRGQLEPYKIPKVIEFVNELPKTSSGKVQKRLLLQ